MYVERGLMRLTCCQGYQGSPVFAFFGEVCCKLNSPKHPPYLIELFWSITVKTSPGWACFRDVLLSANSRGGFLFKMNAANTEIGDYKNND